MMLYHYCANLMPGLFVKFLAFSSLFFVSYVSFQKYDTLFGVYHIF